MSNNYFSLIQNIYNILGPMQPGNLYDINLKNNGNMLLSRINPSIMVGYHHHPLYSCFTPQRVNSNYWTCKNCGCNYTYKVPSFYCTACNYDLCQKCLLDCKLFQIQMYDYDMKEYTNVNMTQNEGNYNTNIHNHILLSIYFLWKIKYILS